MKSLFVPTSPDVEMRPTLDVALTVARRYQSLLAGAAVPSPLTLSVTSGFLGESDAAFFERRDAELAEGGRKLFLDFMAENGVPAMTPTGLSHVWLGGAEARTLPLSEQARVFDLTVFPRPRSPGFTGIAQSFLEACLFESGRPVLVVPPNVGTSFGETVVIAWNRSTETAQTVAHGMPLLREAKRVVVLSLQGVTMSGPPGEQLVASLRRHGIPAEELTAALGGRSSGLAFQQESERLGCDLMFKGAYTQSRLSQMVFGGATAHLLANATMPMLMAH